MEKKSAKNEAVPSESKPEFLYKFRSFENFEYIEDILLNERLYCSLYKDLNDPFEGTFISIFSSPKMIPGKPGPRFSPTKKRKKYKTVDELPIKNLSRVRVCSLSSDYKDVRLWAYYADGSKGIAIKINVKDINSSLHRIEYSRGLPEFEGKNIHNLDPVDILTCKTHHWIFESEYRIINNEEYYSIKGRVNAILLGERIRDQCADLLKKMVSGKIPIISTKLNMEEIKIEINKKLN